MTLGRVLTVEERTAWASAKEWRERAQRAERREAELRNLTEQQAEQILSLQALTNGSAS